MSVRKKINKYFSSFNFFYNFLKLRIFLIVGLSILVGFMDGFGLSMFLPLLQLADGESGIDSEQMGNMAFVVDFMDSVGIPLNYISVLILILSFFLLKGIFKFFEGYFRVIYQQYFIRNIRITNADALADYRYDFFVRSDSGRIQNTFSAEVERVSGAFRTYFMTAQMAVLVIVYIFLAFLSNPQFAILISVGGAVTNLLFKKLYTATKKASKDYTRKAHVFQGLLIQKVANFKYLKATGLAHAYVNKLSNSIFSIEKTQRKIGILSAVMQAIREPLIMLVVVVVIIIHLTIFSQTLGTTIILSLLFFYRALTFLMGMQNQWNSFLGVSGSLENMTQFMKELDSGKESYGDTPVVEFKTEISLKNISFGFGETQVLNNISLNINKNETIAFVGGSGSGKTTLLNLIVGLLNPDSGKIYFDGTEYNVLDKRTLQSKIGYITQEPVIFNDTVFNNVTFWDEKNDHNQQRFETALEQASIFEFVMTQPLKQDSILGSNGINLSGGQRQRLSIARELYKNVDFLMMDEATSALDSETERSIQMNIDALKGQYTMIIIAHRLSTIQNADRIVMLNKGSIEGIGSFSDLINESADFKKMVNLQEFN